MAALSPTIYTQSLKPPTKSYQLARHLTEKSNMGTMLSRRYEQLLRSEKYYDCIFHIGGTSVKCHKLILCAASPVFEAMFYGPICEQHRDIEIIDISIEIFQVLMDYIYVGSVDFEQLTLEQTIELYYGAEKYLLSDLIADTLLAISRKLRFSNILPALELSVCMDLSGLLDVCMSFFKRCCLSDPQYMTQLKTHYLHVTKECVKMIIADNKTETLLYKQNLLWFVHEWCQHEREELGLQQSEDADVLNELQLQESDMISLQLSKTKQQLQQQQCCAIERSYYKACRPFIVDYDAHEWKLIVRCNRFISLYGIVMHSRLTPNIAPTHITHAINFPSEYNENLCIEITKVRPAENSDGEESDTESVERDEHEIIWQHNVSKQPTKYNCDLSIRWEDGVILSPDIEYQIKLCWQSNGYGAEYPCSLLSNVVDGIQFRDYVAHTGSLIKGLRFLNLV